MRRSTQATTLTTILSTGLCMNIVPPSNLAFGKSASSAGTSAAVEGPREPGPFADRRRAYELEHAEKTIEVGQGLFAGGVVGLAMAGLGMVLMLQNFTLLETPTPSQRRAQNAGGVLFFAGAPAALTMIPVGGALWGIGRNRRELALRIGSPMLAPRHRGLVLRWSLQF
jgi:hypothetical protein